MSGAIYQAASGALLQQMRLDVLSNNLANINTAGYKADKSAFRLMPEQATTNSAVAPGRLSPYAPPFEVGIDMADGSMVRTGNPLDVAIAGGGFFEVQGPNGPLYTRNGNFSLNEDGVLTTVQGYPVVGQGGDITLDAGEPIITSQGDISIDGAIVDTLKIVNIENATKLKKVGDTMFTVVDENTEIIESTDFDIVQGSLESSNVDTIRTMTEMIETMRIFEAYQKAIRAVDDMTAKTVNDVGLTV